MLGGEQETQGIGLNAGKELLSAIGAMRALQEAGIQVPTDISVIGYDDVPTASLAWMVDPVST
jgi:hypothetical protein